MMEFLVFITVSALIVIPLFKLLPSYGINPLWALVAALPLGAIVLLWIMASRMDDRRT